MKKKCYFIISIGVCFLLVCSALRGFAGMCQDEWISDQPEQTHILSTVWPHSIPVDCRAVRAKITMTLKVHHYGTSGLLDVICSNTNQFDWGKVYWSTDAISKAGWIGRIHIPPTFVQEGWQTVSFPLRHIHLDWLDDDGNLFFELFGPGYFEGDPDAAFSISSCTLEVVECEADFDDDFDIDGIDLAAFSADFGRDDCSGNCFGDFDDSGTVDHGDLVRFLEEFGWGDDLSGFYNNFDKGEAEGWYTLTPEVWSVEDGVYKMIGSSPVPGEFRGTYYTEEYSDFAFEIRVNCIQGTINYGSGIYFRCNEGGWANCYALYLYQDGGDTFYKIVKNVNGESTTLINWTVSNSIETGYGVWNTFRVVCIGSKISLYINGMQVTSIEDSEFSSGLIGIYAPDMEAPDGTNTIVYFDDARLVSY